VFWAKMSATDSPPEWLSTHPSSETRQLILDTLMPTAILLRDQCKVRPIVGFNLLFVSSRCVQIPVTWLNTFCTVLNTIFSIISRPFSLMYRNMYQSRKH